MMKLPSLIRVGSLVPHTAWVAVMVGVRRSMLLEEVLVLLISTRALRASLAMMLVPSRSLVLMDSVSLPVVVLLLLLMMMMKMKRLKERREREWLGRKEERRWYCFDWTFLQILQRSHQERQRRQEKQQEKREERQWG
jgi:hypothetical protein